MENKEIKPAAESWNPLHMFRAMVGIGIMCSLLIVFTFQFTLPVINVNKAEALEKAIFNVLPTAQSKQTFAYTGNGFEPLNGPNTDKLPLVYAGYNDAGDLVGFAIEASGVGFQDVLRILYGYDHVAQTVIGMQVLESRETPGLGDKIEKDEAYLKNFEALDVSLAADGKTLLHPVESVKSGTKTEPWQVDTITGATITSRAVGNIISTSTGKWLPVLNAHLADFKQTRVN